MGFPFLWAFRFGFAFPLFHYIVLPVLSLAPYAVLSLALTYSVLGSPRGAFFDLGLQCAWLPTRCFLWPWLTVCLAPYAVLSLRLASSVFVFCFISLSLLSLLSLSSLSLLYLFSLFSLFSLSSPSL